MDDGQDGDRVISLVDHEHNIVHVIIQLLLVVVLLAVDPHHRAVTMELVPFPSMQLVVQHHLPVQ
jgi:hypothetical protein